jgi:predicted site-specific integrase-resolvase
MSNYPVASPPERLVPLALAAVRLGVAVQTVYKWRRLGRIEVERNPVTGRYGMRESELLRVQSYIRHRA